VKCTCHPDDNPPRPCPRQFALTECRIAALTSDVERKTKALESVEEWWLSEGIKHFTGAPYAIFAVRAALSNANQ
jgi:hypothetical protein